MATVLLKNNALGFLSTAITAADTGVALETGDGANFPTISGGNYFYATITDVNGDYEIVKVTARSTDSVSFTRAQESTTARAFAAGSEFELRITSQSVLDAISGYGVTTSVANTWTADQTIDAILNIYSGNKARWYNSTDTNPHGVRNNANVLTFDYNGTDYLTANASGVVAFVNPPLVGAAAIYYVGSTDVSVADGGTGASTAANARTNLGLVIGTDVQAYNAILTDFIAQTIIADKLVYADGANSFATTDFTSFGRTLVANATAADTRTDLGLGTMATQAASAVAITGGTINDATIQAPVAVSSETTGTLTTLSKNAIVTMIGDCTIDGNVFAADTIIMFYSGASARTLTQGTSMTMRLAGTASTGSRSLAERTMATAYFVSATEVVVGGGGVS